MEYFKAEDLSCVFGQDGPNTQPKILFSGLSLQLGRGEIVDLIGPSGSGKSHLLTALAMLDPDACAMMDLEGCSCRDFNPQEWRRQVVYLPQRPTLTSRTVIGSLLLGFSFGRGRFSRSSVNSRERPSPLELRKGLDVLGLQDVELDRNPLSLSVGQQARVCLLRSLLLKPKVLLSDEVDAGLDSDSATMVACLLERTSKSTGMAVLRVRHRDADGLASRTLRLEQGSLSEGGAL
ncbi:MAG: ATP-binding cassette domain-containing protein [Bifidobacterium sp.]|uniref:ATP-binding cassette domain-containing protein n=1 Tax=Bifidobacterium fermentum TaxID=3059035 RepID=A0AB39UIK3_9BIFI